MKSGYRETDKICEIISSSPSILQMMCRFGIPLGVGEKTVRQVCEESNVHTGTFLAVANQMSGVPLLFVRGRTRCFSCSFGGLSQSFTPLFFKFSIAKYT